MWLGALPEWEGAMVTKRREVHIRFARRAALQAASVEIRRARFNGSPLYVGTLTVRLQREYPTCVTARGMQSAIARLAAREGVPVVVDCVVLGDYKPI